MSVKLKLLNFEQVGSILNKDFRPDNLDSVSRYIRFMEYGILELRSGKSWDMWLLKKSQQMDFSYSCDVELHLDNSGSHSIFNNFESWMDIGCGVGLDSPIELQVPIWFSASACEMVKDAGIN